jgi:hypothetical protein
MYTTIISTIAHPEFWLGLINFHVIFIAWCLLLFAWLFTQSEFIQGYVDKVFFKINENNCTKPIRRFLVESLWTILGCQKCLTFWTILIITWNPIVAFSFAWIASVTQKK